MATLALLGDTMLGRRVAQRLGEVPPRALFSEPLLELVNSADLAVCNLECCISDRGARWPDPRKPFFFRAPPVAVEALLALGVRAVTCANNHALDYGAEALLDTLDLLDDAGIAHVGAGPDLETARRPAVLAAGGLRIGLIGVADHPSGFAADHRRPGIAYAPLQRHVPGWLTSLVGAVDADLTLVTPHWGPNMVAEPVPHVRAAAAALLAAGAALVAGHSAHVVHGVQAPVLYDLGDFIDDYAVDPRLRNDLGLLWLVTLDAAGPVTLEAVPLALDYCYTRLAEGHEAAEIIRRFRAQCGSLGTQTTERDGRVTVALQT